MTRYVVPDSAIGVEGRTVRCAKCKHSWYQDPPVLEMPPPPAPVAAPREGAEDGARVQAPPEKAAAPAPVVEADASPSDVPQPAERAEQPVPDLPPPPPPADNQPYGGNAQDHRLAGSAASQFDAAPPFRRRRNPLRLWTWAAGIFATVTVGAIAAVWMWGLPDWVPANRPTFGAGQPSLQLDFPAERQERRQLPNGTEYFGASGTVTNTSGQSERVPAILIVLRDSRERIVYSWEVQPPKRTLAPGESITVNEAVTDVPRSARFAEIGWKPD